MVVLAALVYLVSMALLSAHQEFRFLFAVLPALHLLIVDPSTSSRRRRIIRIVAPVVYVLNVSLAVYLSTRHQVILPSFASYEVNGCMVRRRGLSRRLGLLLVIFIEAARRLRLIS